MIATPSRRTSPRFKPGQKARVIKRVYYPESILIPADLRRNRQVIIEKVLAGGRLFACSIPGYPNTIDYSPRELRKRSSR